MTPLSRLQSYAITGDAAFLPPRPIVISIDDGSQSVLKLFHPRALKRKFPYTIALDTSWMSETDESTHGTGEPGGSDPTMTWKEAKQLYESGLVEVISHSDGLHYQAMDLPLSDEGLPAETVRQWLVEKNRLETTQEYERRIRIDMDTSRRKLAEHGFPIPSFLCWPYGEWSLASKAIARQSGFTHFLGFDTPPIFVSRDTAADGNLPRIPVLRKDETIPLNFPTDKAEQQAWWLAFPAGRDSNAKPQPAVRDTRAVYAGSFGASAGGSLARRTRDHQRQRLARNTASAEIAQRQPL